MKLYFDLDDTLYDRVQPFAKAIKQEFPQLLVHPVQEVYDTFQHFSESVFDKMQEGVISLQDLHIYRATHMAAHYGIEIDINKALAFQQAYQCNQTKIELSDQMKDLLDSLVENHIEIGIITNGDAKHQRMKIQQLDLLKWFDNTRIFISGEVGIMKPHAKIFELAGSGPTYVYVGDSYPNDVVGSKQVDWTCIWLKKKDVEQTPIQADYLVYDEQQMCMKIKELFQIK
ncbi:putative hydrolase of the HAD superfamily [Breznakia blatticola]|uniref:Putative hydrolase of the HAD superfamily n=1 Tax=Breznakia blatticola TaxID=1754012 RepID=A0A4V3G6W4_9FIRM|nr:HAD family hydrolase [Breznakia blatticola]TDW16934.1 putative hydrolase of the HAD superfamily [Breznakia blatticola]